MLPYFAVNYKLKVCIAVYAGMQKTADLSVCR